MGVIFLERVVQHDNLKKSTMLNLYESEIVEKVFDYTINILPGTFSLTSFLKQCCSD